MIKPGNLFEVHRGSGYGMAFGEKGYTTIPNGTLCVLVGSNRGLSRHRGQPIVDVLVGSDMLSLDERFLRVVKVN